MLGEGTILGTIYNGTGAILSVVSGYYSQEKSSHQSIKPLNTDILRSPFITVVQIALLHFKPHKTKLIFVPNALEYQEPGVFTKIARTWYYYLDPSAGAGRDYLSAIKDEFALALKWYPVGSNEKMDEIYKISKMGLEALAKTYAKTHVVSFCNEVQQLIDTDFKLEENRKKAVEQARLKAQRKKEKEEKKKAIGNPETLSVGTPESVVSIPQDLTENEEDIKGKEVDKSEKPDNETGQEFKLKIDPSANDLEFDFEMVEKPNEGVPEKDLSRKIKALIDETKINSIHGLFLSAIQDKDRSDKESLNSSINSINVFVQGRVGDLKKTISSHFDGEIVLG